MVSDWLSVHSKAIKAGQGELAAYLMRRYVNKLVEQLGKDDDAFFELNAKARIIAPDGSNWVFARQPKTGSLCLEYIKN